MPGRDLERGWAGQLHGLLCRNVERGWAGKLHGLCAGDLERGWAGQLHGLRCWEVQHGCESHQRRGLPVVWRRGKERCRRPEVH